MTSGIQLWNKAEEIIPGGNGLLSKRPDRYAPGIWPTYFTKCSGVDVYDLNKTKFIDMAQMGIGTAILGYSNQELSAEVIKGVNQGVNCTLNSYEEVKLAELLLELNPFAGGVKFARSGGEALSMAVRIARAATNRDKVAFSGYHGWCDWYLAANIGNENNLQDHLLPGLEAKGVPKNLAGSSIPFKYNNVEDFMRVVSSNEDIGVICIEGARYDYPNQSFLKKIMEIAKLKNIIIISDEITSGWRITDGGVYKVNNFKPDIVVYAKAMGGGFAISAIVGTKEIMKYAAETFISSTMWTERIGFIAAIKTIEIITRDKVWEHLITIGNMIGSGWELYAKKHGLKLSITDFKPLISFKLNYGVDNDKIITLFIQEMLKRGYLSASSIYVSFAHTQEIVQNYLNVVDEVFEILSKAIQNNNIEYLLEGNPRSDSFGRIT